MRQVVALGFFGTLFLASGLLFLSGQLLVPATLIIWLGVSVLLAGITYMVQFLTGQGGTLFFKSRNGSLHPISLLLFLPFISTRYVNLLIYRLFSREPPLTLLDEGLLIGGRIFPWDLKALAKEQVAAILDLTAELPRDLGTRTAGLQYAALPVLDGTSPTQQQLSWGVDWILGQLEAGRTVLVQCTVGHGRSATFAAGALLSLGRVKTIDEAVRLMRSKRSRIGLNRPQYHALEQALANGSLRHPQPR